MLPPRPADASTSCRGRFGLVARGKCWSIDRSNGLASRSLRYLPLALWAGIAWVLLTWTATLEQLAYGVAVSIGVAVVLYPLGPVATPWRLLHPRRFLRLAAVLATSAGRILWANLVLARRVWLPSRPIRTGMLVVPTDLRTDGGITAIGLLGSIIVDHQLVDLEPGRLQYHAVWVASADPIKARERINGRLERLLQPIDEEGHRE
jgi:multicomponent Na+:H+ antiporter subunit E